MENDPFSKFKAVQREGWALFIPYELITGTTAPALVKFAGVKAGSRVLDVGCGTGVAGITAARKGARVTGLDLTPELIARAKENTRLCGVEAEWQEGDVEALPFKDGSFDVVLSQFGHMFAPRPDVAVREMLRVLAPGGTIAFSTWPPELYTGRMFALTGKYSPPPPPGASPPPQWGDPNIVRERLGAGVKDLTFTRGTMMNPSLSPAHLRASMEQNVAPMIKVVQLLASEPDRLASFRRELDELIAVYFEDNYVRQDYLISRAIKA